MPVVRKHRAPPPEEANDDAPSDSPSSAEEPPSASASRRRRRTDEAREGESLPPSDSEGGETYAPTGTDVMVKKLVRLALASEYSRQPIRRTDISTKVLGEQGSRQFKLVFEQAQRILRGRFGMEMIELPGKDKVTISQRRAAQRVEKPSTGTKSWILISNLPPAYRTPAILSPTKAPSSDAESTYIALYTFLISLITLSGGSLPEQKLDRYLKRANADTYTPIDRTDRLLQRLCKDGYLVRNREMDGGEEVIEYMVGPRGKIEVGENGVAGLVREVYGRPHPQAPTDTNDGNVAGENDETDDFEKRLESSIASSRL